MSLQLMIRYSDGDGGDIIMDGFTASIGNDARSEERSVGKECRSRWGTLQYYIRKEQKPVPLFLGYSLLLVSVVGYILLPLSSFWLLIPQALIMIGGTSMGVKGY